MGTISSGVGLVSGLNIEDIVSQLIAIDSRPIEQLKQRVTETQEQQAAYMELSALLLGAKSAIHGFIRPSAFLGKTVASSDQTVLNGSADTSAMAGSYSFLVRSLAASHQLVSSGFADADQTAVGAGTLVFARAEARLDPKTSVSTLNGFNGIRRGMIRITDRSGASASVDLRTVTNVSEIVDLINSAEGISVTAGTRGGRIVIQDSSGLTSGNLVISDLSGGRAATELGIAGTFSSGQVLGKDLLWMTENTRLAALNDGMGVRSDGLLSDLRFELKGGEIFEVSLSSNLRLTMRLDMLNSGRGVRADENGERVIRITNRQGASVEVDLSAAATLGDVSTAVAGAGISVSMSLSGGKIIVTDSSGGTNSNLKIEDVKGSAAADLGIAIDTNSSGATGQQIYRMDTIGDVLRAIQYAEGNEDYVTASLSADGKGITITDSTTGLGDTLISAVNGSRAIYDLGLVDSRDVTERAFSGTSFTSTDLLGGLNTVMLKSLKGGAGVRVGTVDFTRTNGEAFTLDFTGARTLADVMEIINTDGRLNAEIDVGGTGIVIRDTSGGAAPMSASGALAEDLGLVARDGTLASGNLHRQYISESTPLASLMNGKGIRYGQIRLSDSKGNSATLTLHEATHRTVGDVLRDINRLFVGIEASINDTGDGIKLVDTAGGTLAMSVSDVSGGHAAEDLKIKGLAVDGAIVADYGGRIEIDGDDTLNDVVRKINAADIGVRAGVINDGSGLEPFRLTLTSTTSGMGGRLALEMTPGLMELNVLSEARDAVVVVGDLNSPNALVLASGSNTMKNAVQGLTLNLASAGDKPVTLSVANDVDSVVTGMQSFVEAFNNAVDQIAELTRYDFQTGDKGPLFGENTVLRVRDEFYRMLLGTVGDKSLKYTNVTQVGLTLEVWSGGKLQFNEEKFREAFAEDPDAVNKLFTRIITDEDGESTQIGIAAKLDNLLSRFTSSVDGTLTLRNETLQDQIDQYNKRQAELQAMLDDREQALYNKFYAMELALSQLQSQQSALATLASMVSATKTG